MLSKIAVLAAAEAPRALAECWTRSDGVRVCSADPAGWLSVWWFWFALLLLVALVSGCWDSCGKGVDDCDDDAVDAVAAAKTQATSAAGSVAISVSDPFPSKTITEPLLEPPRAKKPSYRYL